MELSGRSVYEMRQFFGRMNVSVRIRLKEQPGAIRVDAPGKLSLGLTYGGHGINEQLWGIPFPLALARAKRKRNRVISYAE